MSGSAQRATGPALLVAVAVVALVLTACGSSGSVLPSRSASPTRSAVLPSRTPAATTQPATPPRTVSAAPTAEPATPAATQTDGVVVAASSSSTSPPAWLWWLIGAVVLAIAVIVAVLMRRRGRRRAWAEQLSAAAAEVTWFARQLIPQLGQAASVQQMLGGWQISAGRVVALEDRLTALEAEAGEETSRGRARALRDAVRDARTHLDALAAAWDMSAAMNHLKAAAAELEATLASIGLSTQPAQTVGPPAR